MIIHDWFGTRLDPGVIQDGLHRVGLSQVSLTLTDEGVRMTVEPNTEREVVGRALVWLREQLSPLTSVTVETQPEVTNTINDARTRTTPTVVMAEVWSEEALEGRLDDLVQRLGPPTPPSAPMPWPGQPKKGY